MKQLFPFFVVVASAVDLLAWDTLQDMEQEAATRILDEAAFLNTNFTAELTASANSTNSMVKATAHILLSIQDYDKYLQEDNDACLVAERNNASNAVSAIGVERDSWQYWIGRLIHAGAYLSIDDTRAAYTILTNSISDIESSPPNLTSNALERKILEKHEVPNVDMATALRIFAGATSAAMGQRCAATNFAAQVPAIFTTNILEILNGSE